MLGEQPRVDSLDLALLQSVHVDVDSICVRGPSALPSARRGHGYGRDVLPRTFVQDACVAELHVGYCWSEWQNA